MVKQEVILFEFFFTDFHDFVAVFNDKKYIIIKGFYDLIAISNKKYLPNY